ncbi:MAG: hypothetical protein WA916_05485 [Arcobacter sp.]|uniref:hypothetical protein n=1 Tax=Arcobacter sp. TaxID=1872629 RepID=UPI003C764EAF
MKFFYLGTILIFLLFNGCANKELVTNKYFKAYTKDEILNASKLAFKDVPNSEYIVDSYRNKLEVTKIELFYNILKKKEYILKVDEDNCGTSALLKVKTSDSDGKNIKYNDIDDHNEIWNRIDYFLGKKNEVLADGKKLTKDKRLDKMFINYVQNISNNKIIKPTKDMTNCVIKNEFAFGVIKDKIDEENENK